MNALGAEETAAFSKAMRKPLCSELMQLKMQIQVDPESSQIRLRLVKATGLPNRKV